MTYEVFTTGGSLDGKNLETFDNFSDALDYAHELETKFADQFDSVCGGVGMNEYDDNGVRNEYFEW